MLPWVFRRPSNYYVRRKPWLRRRPEGVALTIAPAVVNLLAKAPTAAAGGVSLATSPALVNLLGKAPTLSIGGVSLTLSPALVNLLGKVVGMNGVFPGAGIPHRISYLLRQMKIGRIR